ncbi:MAG: nucleotidyltransferase family protein [Endomicrobia bacterium]|nr:nucleotidyltransferase family protein [Endomicrobiia bacterium]
MKENCIDNSIFVKNILIHHQLDEILNETEKLGIKVVLLKGAALIELFPEYSFCRDMEDIDVLINKKDYKKFIKLLFSLGYKFCDFDPKTLYKENMPAKIDVSCELWYLSKKENVEIMRKLCKINNFYILPVSEMVRNILYHMYVEHNSIETKWEKDVELLKSKYNIKEDVMKEMKEILKNRLIKILLKAQVMYKGHILQFFILPFGKKLNYIFNKIFPEKEFLIHRYKVKTQILLPVWYLYRCCSIFFRIGVFFSKLLNFHLSTLFSK